MRLERPLMTGGWRMMMRCWPAVVWTYVFNLGFAFLFAVPLHLQIAALTQHTLAAQRLSAGFDLGLLIQVAAKLSDGHSSAAGASNLGLPVYLVLYFLLVPGTLFCYQTDTPARLVTLLESGLRLFWRFVRLTLISLAVFALILGPLLAVQNAWSSHVNEQITGRSGTLHVLAGYVLLGLVAAVLRVYFDLVEVYTVQLGTRMRLHKKSGELIPDRRVRRAFKPAWKAMRAAGLRLYGIFVVLTLLGLSVVVIAARISMHSLAQPRVWPSFLLTQAALFCMLATRFWQRGAETTLAMQVPIPLAVEPAVELEIIEVVEIVPGIEPDAVMREAPAETIVPPVEDSHAG